MYLSHYVEQSGSVCLSYMKPELCEEARHWAEDEYNPEDIAIDPDIHLISHNLFPLSLLLPVFPFPSPSLLLSLSFCLSLPLSLVFGLDNASLLASLISSKKPDMQSEYLLEGPAEKAGWRQGTHMPQFSDCSHP